MVAGLRVSGCALFGVALALAQGCGDSERDGGDDGPLETAGTGGSASDAGSAGAPPTGGRAASSGGNGGSAVAGRTASASGGSTSGGSAMSGATNGGDGAGNEGGEGAEATGGNAAAGTGAGGSGGEASGMHCEPGEVVMTYPPGTAMPCYGDRWAFGLPNASDIQLEDFRLDTPAAAGERMAVSVRHVGRGPFNIEIWGADAECGVADELLWWGPMVEGIQCAEFTPRKTYSHLLYVYRRLNNDSYSFSSPELGLCPGGSCPGGADGHGLEPGGTLETPPPVYERNGSEFLRHGFDLRLGVYGRMVLLVDGYKQPRGTTNPITRGFLRLHPDDPFGDAWYCVGEGSTYLESADEEADTATVSLKNLTRLPACVPGSASVAISLGSDFTADITSSLADLAGTGISADEQACDGTFCAFRFYQTDDTLALWGYRWLSVTPAAPVGSYLEPTRTPTAINEATLFFQPGLDDDLRITCAGAGSITYDPEAQSSIALDAASDYFACPGEPVENDSFEFSLKPP